MMTVTDIEVFMLSICLMAVGGCFDKTLCRHSKEKQELIISYFNWPSFERRNNIMVSFTRKAVAAAPVFALILIIRSENGIDMLRRLAIHCVKNVYANEVEILKIPEIPANTNNNVPAYIALCQN